jgi:hypothetical protein
MRDLVRLGQMARFRAGVAGRLLARGERRSVRRTDPRGAMSSITKLGRFLWDGC